MNSKYFLNYKSAGALLTLLIQAFFINTCLAFQAPGKEGDNIRINQIGFYPYAPKTAIILNTKDTVFYIETIQKKQVYKGKLNVSTKASFAGALTSIADFTNFHSPGKYILYVSDAGYSNPFEIKEAVHKPVADATIKAYYFMRASIPLKEKYAGKWSRAEGHPDTAVLIHSSAATDKSRQEQLYPRRGAGMMRAIIINTW